MHKAAIKAIDNRKFLSDPFFIKHLIFAKSNTVLTTPATKKPFIGNKFYTTEYPEGNLFRCGIRMASVCPVVSFFGFNKV
ncbi:hypothetical protein MASR1M12_09590 [Erysipelotrichia bacterium]